MDKLEEGYTYIMSNFPIPEKPEEGTNPTFGYMSEPFIPAADEYQWRECDVCQTNFVLVGDSITDDEICVNCGSRYCYDAGSVTPSIAQLETLRRHMDEWRNK